MSTPDANGWYPIETAPKDGTKVLLYRQGWLVIGRWNDNRHARRANPFWDAEDARLKGWNWARKNDPTHWQPLPGLPEAEGREP